MVDTVGLDQAQELVRRLHYAKGSSNTAVYRHGLFRREEWPFYVRGVALWLPPTRVAAEKTLRQMGIDGDWRRVLSLTRLVIEPEVPTNGASFLIGRSIRMIRKLGDWDVLVTFADERQGHLGGIYKATNWSYLGGSVTGGWVVNGVQRSRKAGPRTRTRDEMLALGGVELEPETKHKFGMVLA